jgi:S1-C subfamily serine protease
MVCSIFTGTWPVLRLTLAFFVAITPSLLYAETASDHVNRASNAVVLIKAHLRHGLLEDDEASGRWTGSGFLIDRENGWIVTNAHVAGFGPTDLRMM